MYLPSDLTLCNLEQAKRLKALGLDQFADISYYEYPEGAYIPTMDRGNVTGRVIAKRIGNYPNYPEGGQNDFSAFNTSELGEMLPVGAMSFKAQGNKGNLAWACVFADRKQYGKTEAEARANMLIELIEANIVVPSMIRKVPYFEGESVSEFVSHAIPAVQVARERYVKIAEEMTDAEKEYFMTIDKTGLIEEFVCGRKEIAMMRSLVSMGAVEQTGTRGYGNGIMYFPSEGVMRYIEAESGL